jgi:hypothetical protein
MAKDWLALIAISATAMLIVIGSAPPSSSGAQGTPAGLGIGLVGPLKPWACTTPFS